MLAQLRDLDVAAIEIVEGVRLVIGDAMESARLPMLKVES